MIQLNLPEPLNSLTSGLEPSTITNFYGMAGTGKTNVCLLAAINCIRNGGNVFYIDSEGGFSLKRFEQLTSEHENALKKIELTQPRNFAEQGKIIKELEKRNPNLVIVDSMVALYRLEYADPKIEILEANRELSKQLSMLSNIAKEKNIPVLITAHTFKNWDTGEDDIIGGNVLKYWSKIIVFLEKTGKMSERKATIVKHRYLPEGKSAKFMLVQNGIKPGGFKLF